MTAEGGSRWVMKATYFGGQQHKYLYLNEGLSALIGLALQVPVPEPAILRLEHEQARPFKSDASEADLVIFATERIEPVESLSSEAVDAVGVDPPAAITVMDQLIWNTDRHGKPEHVLAQQSDEHGWRIWAVDHGHCFSIQDTLQDADLHPERQTQDPDPLLARNLSADDLAPYMTRAAAFSEQDYEEMVRTLPAEWIIEPDAPNRLAKALCRRAEALERVLYGKI
jgi:hypothetical protein